MSGCEGTDLLVPNPQLCQCFLKERQRLFLAVAHLVGKFKSVVRLDALNGVGKFLHHMPQKLRGGIGALLLERLQIAEAAVFVNEGVLVEFLSGSISDQTGRRNIFHIDLSPLPWIFHLFIRFWDIFGVGQLDGPSVDAAQELVQAGDGSGVATLPQLHPEHHKARMRVPAAHIPDQLDLGLCVLVGMAVGPMGAVCQRSNCSVVFLSPAVDVLSAGLVADGGGRNAVFQRIFNYCLLKPHVLCYLIHSG